MATAAVGSGGAGSSVALFRATSPYQQLPTTCVTAVVSTSIFRCVVLIAPIAPFGAVVLFAHMAPFGASVLIAPFVAAPTEELITLRSIPSGAPRRAAAEAEHTVVRGYNYGKQIDVPESTHMEEFDFALKEKPPYATGFYNNRAGSFEVQEMDKGGQSDHNDLVMGDRPCS
nr:hypothetical protein Iba_chr01aCG4530 [Ipomoea batatas]